MTGSGRLSVCRWGQIGSLFVRIDRRRLLRTPGDTLVHSGRRRKDEMGIINGEER